MVAPKPNVANGGALVMQLTARTLVIAVIGVAAIGYAANVGAQRDTRSEDEEAIKRMIVEMTMGFNNHDARAASSMYTSDAKLTTVRGEVMNGRAEIEKGLASIFATRAKNATHRTLDVSIRFLRPDIALAHVTNELSGLVTPEGQELPAHQEFEPSRFRQGRCNLACRSLSQQWSGLSLSH